MRKHLALWAVLGWLVAANAAHAAMVATGGTFHAQASDTGLFPASSTPADVPFVPPTTTHTASVGGAANVTVSGTIGSSTLQAHITTGFQTINPPGFPETHGTASGNGSIIFTEDATEVFT